jgi:hypothetical protein
MRMLPTKPIFESPVALVCDTNGMVLCTDARKMLDTWQSSSYSKHRESNTSRPLSQSERAALEAPDGPLWLVETIKEWKSEPSGPMHVRVPKDPKVSGHTLLKDFVTDQNRKPHHYDDEKKSQIE